MHKAGLFMMLTTLSLFLLAVLWGYWGSSCIKILFDEAVLQRFRDGPRRSNRPAYSTARRHSNYVMTAML